MQPDELIVCRDVFLGYEGRHILSGLNLTLRRGDYLCVVGDNGSGKSTLMRGLLGLLPPQLGTIEQAPELRQGAIGYLPQQTLAQRDFPATVLEVVLSGCLNRRGTPLFLHCRPALRGHDESGQAGHSGAEGRVLPGSLRRAAAAGAAGAGTVRQPSPCWCWMSPSPDWIPPPPRISTRRWPT